MSKRSHDQTLAAHLASLLKHGYLVRRPYNHVLETKMWKFPVVRAPVVAA
jgi:hypothetical protein